MGNEHTYGRGAKSVMIPARSANAPVFVRRLNIGCAMSGKAAASTLRVRLLLASAEAAWGRYDPTRNVNVDLRRTSYLSLGSMSNQSGRTRRP